MLVREWMHPDPVSVPLGTPLLEAEWRMEEGGFRHLPVVDEEGRLLGIVSDRDLRLAAPSSLAVGSRLEFSYLLSRATVGEVMRTPVRTARPGEPAEAAAVRMREHGIGALPVVEDGRLVGMVTTSDMLDALVAVLASLRAADRAAERAEDGTG